MTALLRPRSCVLVRASTLALLALALTGCSGEADVVPTVESVWPPVVGQPFPDLTLLDHHGEEVALSSFTGRVLLIEPIAIPCRGCISYAGGSRFGAFEDVEPQSGLQSIDDYYEQYTGGYDITDETITVIQLLFFNKSMKTPTLEEAKAWAAHFEIDERPNHYLLIGPAALRARTRAKIPGFWLVDHDFVVRCDAAGNGAPSNLFSHLLPMVPGLIRATPSAPR